MNKQRELAPKGVITYSYVLLTAILTVAFMILPIISLKEEPLYISIPVCALTFFTTWEFLSYVLLYIVITIKPKASSEKTVLDQNLAEYPFISFVIPSFHEPFDVAKLTLDSALEINYPGVKEIIVVDNSTNVDSSIDFIKWRDYVVEMGEKTDWNVSVRFIHNDDTAGLKPGNLDLAQSYLSNDSEYVVFLDIDSTLPCDSNLLQRSIAEFGADNTLGWVQFLTKSTNNSFNKASEAIGVYQNLLRITCHFRSFGGFTLFYGHNAIWKRECLEKLGPWLEKHRGQIMVTEDILKSIIAYNSGYYGKSIGIETGEWVPNSLGALESMWQRWTYGTCQIIGKYFFPILKTKRMTFLEKYDLLHSILLYWGYAITYPLAILYQFLLPPDVSWVFIIISCMLPQIFSGISVYKHYLSSQHKSITEKVRDFYTGAIMISSFVTVVQLKGTYNYLLNVDQGWKVTEKRVKGSKSFWYITKRYILYLVFGFGMLGSSVISWAYNFDMEPIKLLNYAPMLIISFNLILSIVFFGNASRKVSNSVEGSTIDFVNGRIDINNNSDHLVKSENYTKSLVLTD